MNTDTLRREAADLLELEYQAVMSKLSKCWEPNVGHLGKKRVLATEPLSNAFGMFPCSLPVWPLKVDAPWFSSFIPAPPSTTHTASAQANSCADFQIGAARASLPLHHLFKASPRSCLTLDPSFCLYSRSQPSHPELGGRQRDHLKMSIIALHVTNPNGFSLSFE